MKKIISSSVVLLACTSTLFASGYRIPEQSFAATAKAGANIASTNGADSAYYNPANMVFLEDKFYTEFALTYINLPSMKYTDAQINALDSDSKTENFLAPALHFVSPAIAEKLRFGLSFTAPGGLAKRWDDYYAKSTAEKFELKIMELSPSFAYKIYDGLSVALGARMTYIDGEVKSNALREVGGQNMVFSRELSGDSIDFGYNLGITYKPVNMLTFSSTYRSNIDLTLKGDATLVGGPISSPFRYSGGASIAIPLPAVFDIAVSYDFGDTVVEAVYERTYWSKYKNLDFNYDSDLTKNPYLANFDTPLPKNWQDVNAYRIGITHDFTDKFSLLAGFAYDESPAVYDKYFGFELPDSDARLYSLGALYKITKDMSIGLSYLYDYKKTRSVNNRTQENTTGLNGTFKNGSAHLVTTSFEYKF